MIERHAQISTKDGRMNTFVCHPERGGPHPVILFFMDAPGIREELRDMVRRLAAVGYYVMLPNLYYRAGVEELGSYVGEAHAATRQKALALMATINIPLVMDDIDALRAELERARGNAEVEIYPGTHHGFAFPQRPVFDKPAAERHWERLFALFGAALAGSYTSRA